jgi:hypothetical protein
VGFRFIYEKKCFFLRPYGAVKRFCGIVIFFGGFGGF